MKKKTLLIIGAGADQTIGIKKAKKMGFRVVATDGNKEAHGLKFADDFEIASVYDEEGTIVAAQNLNKMHKIDAVMAMGTDTPVVVSKIAAKFGLPGINIKTAILATNKYEMKKRFKQYNIPIPWFEKVNSYLDLKQKVREKGFPLIVKPQDSRAARGVILIDKNVNLKWAYNESLSYSPSKKLMVEEYLEGPQFSTESILWDNFAITPGISRRNYPFLKRYKPYIIEDGDDLPPELNKTQETSIKLLAEKGARALGINRWSAKGDLVLTKDGPKIIEMAARISGGQFATVQIPYNTGVDFLRAAILMALGKKPDFEQLIPKINRFVSQRYFFHTKGKIKKITGIEKLARKKWVLFYTFYLKEGDHVKKMVSMNNRSGNVVVCGSTLKEARERAKKAIKMVTFEIDE